MSLDTQIEDLINREGDYSNDPADAGGETKFGVTKREAIKFGYTGDMRDFPRTLARAYYRKKCWEEPGYSRVNDYFPLLADKLLDFGVNAGTQTASKALQDCLNVLNDGGTIYPDLVVDGNIGPATLYALDAYLRKRKGEGGEKVLMFMVAAQQSVHYIDIAKARPQNERFMYGWQSQRALYDVIP